MKRLPWVLAVVALALGAWIVLWRSAPQSAAPDRGGPAIDPRKQEIVVSDGAGTVLYGISGAEAGARFAVVDGGGRRLAEIVQGEGSFSVTGEDGKLQYRVRRQGSDVQLEDGSGAVLYRVQVQGQTLKLLSGANAPVLTAEKTGMGYKVMAPDGRVTDVIEAVGTVVRSVLPGHVVRVKVEGLTRPQAAVWLMVDPLQPVERASLAIYFMRML